MDRMSVHSEAVGSPPRGDDGDAVPADFDDEAPDAPDLPADRFSSRELSWLDYAQRVLAQAEDRRNPLLERLKFLAIFASNLDEFYMVRVAGLKRRQDMGLAVQSADGLTPRETLARIAVRAQELVQRHARCWLDDVEPALAAVGIRVLHWDELDPAEQQRLGDYFRAQVFPVLTPLAVDPAHPFPYISGLSLNLAVLVRNPKNGREHFARVKVPPIFDRLLAALEKGLQRRRFGPPVRLEVEETVDDHVLDLLVSELGINPAEVVRVPGPLDLRGLHDIADLDRAELKYPAFLPATHTHLAEVESASPVDIFAAARRHDVLLHHPYDSFSTSVQRFIEQAAADPAVLAIKQTLYRT